jgi:hypothetical protein
VDINSGKDGMKISMVSDDLSVGELRWGATDLQPRLTAIYAYLERATPKGWETRQRNPNGNM